MFVKINGHGPFVVLGEIIEKSTAGTSIVEGLPDFMWLGVAAQDRIGQSIELIIFPNIGPHPSNRRSIGPFPGFFGSIGHPLSVDDSPLRGRNSEGNKIVPASMENQDGLLANELLDQMTWNQRLA